MIKNNSCVSCEYAFYHQDEVPCVDCVNDSHWKQKTHKSDEESKEISGMSDTEKLHLPDGCLELSEVEKRAIKNLLNYSQLNQAARIEEAKDPRVKCVCGWKGTLGDLVTDDDELDCPRCGTCGWCFA